MKIKKMNKKGALPLIAIGVIIAGIVLVLITGGGLVKFNIGQIPAPVWILLFIILLFKLSGGKKK